MALETVTEKVGTELTPEPFMRLRRPVQAAVSRDGTRAAFAVASSFSRPDERPRGEIWTATLDGDCQQATRGPGTDTLPRWGPDGTLAFASDRDHPGRLSLYLLGPGPGEARPLGDVGGSVEDAQWSPDGSELLVLAADIGADRAGIQAATRIEEVGAAERDPKVTRPLAAWRRLYRVDAATGETTELGPPGVNVWEFDWRGGSRVVAVASDEPSESAWYGAYLALVDLNARTAERIYTPEWQIAVPRLVGEEHVCFVEGFCSDRGVLAGTATSLELGSGRTTVLAPELDISWLQRRDDSSVWYAGWRGMGSMCGSLSLDGAVEELWSGESTIGLRFQPQLAVGETGAVVVAIMEGPDEPPEIVALDAASPRAKWRPLSRLNADVAAEIPSVPWEARSWPGRDGLEIEGLLVRPPAADGPTPLVVMVHGGPTGLWSYLYGLGWNGMASLLASAGYAVLLPNPRGSAGRGQDFARANLGDMGGGDLEDILAGVDDCVEAGIADTDRVGIIGGSYGGFMSAWAVTQTDRFAASVPVACVSDWLSFHLTTNIGRFDELFLDADPYDPAGAYAARSPVLHARRCRTPTLVLHGEDDLCTPIGQAQELYQALVEAGVETELVVYPREGHGFYEWDHQLDAWERIRAWFDRHLGATRVG